MTLAHAIPAKRRLGAPAIPLRCGILRSGRCIQHPAWAELCKAITESMRMAHGSAVSRLKVRPSLTNRALTPRPLSSS